MHSNSDIRVPAKPVFRLVAGSLLALALTASCAAKAQSQDNSHDNAKDRPVTTEVFHLTHISQDNDLSDLTTALRNTLAVKVRIFPYSNHDALIVSGTTEEIELARKLIAELDKPIPLYRLTYTITQIEDGKRAGSQKYTLLAANRQKVVLKRGDKVPILTGAFNTDKSGPETQFQYIDTGLNISATYEGSMLKTSLEETAVSDEKSNVGIQDPVIKQSSLMSNTPVAPGTPAVLGSFDIPNSTKHQEVEVLVERVQ